MGITNPAGAFTLIKSTAEDLEGHWEGEQQPFVPQLCLTTRKFSISMISFDFQNESLRLFFFFFK